MPSGFGSSEVLKIFCGVVVGGLLVFQVALIRQLEAGGTHAGLPLQVQTVELETRAAALETRVEQLLKRIDDQHAKLAKVYADCRRQRGPRQL